MFDITFQNVDGRMIETGTVTEHIPAFMDALYMPEALKYITKEELRDMFHSNQVRSKAWLFEQFDQLDLNKNSKVLLVGSWAGFATLCLQKMGFADLTEVELDSKCLAISQNVVNNVTRFHTDINLFADINDYDVIVNLACEHIANDYWFQRIGPDKLLILQSNNLVIPTHTNICNNISDMIQKYPMKNTMFYGTLILEGYNRFMMIGSK